MQIFIHASELVERQNPKNTSPCDSWLNLDLVAILEEHESGMYAFFTEDSELAYHIDKVCSNPDKLFRSVTHSVEMMKRDAVSKTDATISSKGDAVQSEPVQTDAEQPDQSTKR